VYCKEETCLVCQEVPLGGLGERILNVWRSAFDFRWVGEECLLPFMSKVSLCSIASSSILDVRATWSNCGVVVREDFQSVVVVEISETKARIKLSTQSISRGFVKMNTPQFELGYICHRISAVEGTSMPGVIPTQCKVRVVRKGVHMEALCNDSDFWRVRGEWLEHFVWKRRGSCQDQQISLP